MFSAIFLLPCLLLVGAQHCGPEELDGVGEQVTACVIRCPTQVFLAHYLSDTRRASRIRPPPSLARSTCRCVRCSPPCHLWYFIGGGLRHCATDPGGVRQHVGCLLHTTRGERQDNCGKENLFSRKDNQEASFILRSAVTTDQFLPNPPTALYTFNISTILGLLVNPLR